MKFALSRQFCYLSSKNISKRIHSIVFFLIIFVSTFIQIDQSSGILRFQICQVNKLINRCGENKLKTQFMRILNYKWQTFSVNKIDLHNFTLMWSLIFNHIFAFGYNYPRDLFLLFASIKHTQHVQNIQVYVYVKQCIVIGFTLYQ